MKLISYTLYGDNPRYTQPLILNVKLSNQFYKEWQIRVYHDDTVPIEIVSILRENSVSLINIKDTIYSNFAPKFWRFLPVFENNYDIIIFRDSDSILTQRESNYVNDWVDSSFDFHIIRDHNLHISPILAGMFGIKKNYFSLFEQQLLSYKKLTHSTKYNADQLFLGNYVYNKIIKNCLIHTSYFAFYGEKFVRIDKVIDSTNFIGSVYINETNENSTIINYDFIIGIPYELAKFLKYKIRPVLFASYIFNLILRTTSNIFLKRSSK
jgi:hypothetical protein